MDSPDLGYDELLSALSTVTFQLHRTRKALEKAEQQTLEMKRVFDNIKRVLDGAEVPQLHVVNRIEWLRDKALPHLTPVRKRQFSLGTEEEAS